jgi:hypothetical protein
MSYFWRMLVFTSWAMTTLLAFGVRDSALKVYPPFKIVE